MEIGILKLMRELYWFKRLKFERLATKTWVVILKLMRELYWIKRLKFERLTIKTLVAYHYELKRSVHFQLYLCFHSTCPFCWWVWGQGCLNMIPLTRHDTKNLYSPPQSVWRHLILELNCFSTSLSKVIKVDLASNWSLKGKIQVNQL